MSICFSCYQRPSRPAAADCYRLYADWKRMDQKGSCINMDPKVPKFNRFFLSFSFRSAPDFKDSFFIWFVLVFLSSSTTQTSLGWLCREIQKKKEEEMNVPSISNAKHQNFPSSLYRSVRSPIRFRNRLPPPPKKRKTFKKKTRDTQKKEIEITICWG